MFEPSVDDGWQSRPPSIEDEFGPYLGDTALAAYQVLRRHLNSQRGDAWPAVATIAFYLRRSKPTVLKAIAALERVALIRVERTKGKGQMRDRNRYFLLPVEGARERLQTLIADGALHLTDDQRAYLDEVGGPRVRQMHVVKPVDHVVNEIDNAPRSKTALLRSKAILPELESESLFQEDSERLRTACQSDTEPAISVQALPVAEVLPTPPAAPPQAVAPVSTPQAALFQDTVSCPPRPAPAPKARPPRPKTPRSDIEDALAETCWPGTPAKEVWALYGGLIRRYGKEIDAANASLDVPITGQEIRDRCGPGQVWYRTYLALDDQRRPTKHPTPGAIRKWLRNLDHMLAAGDGASRTPPPAASPPVWTAPAPPPEPVSAEARRAARQQAWKEHLHDTRPQPPLARQDRPVPPGQRPP